LYKAEPTHHNNLKQSHDQMFAIVMQFIRTIYRIIIT